MIELSSASLKRYYRFDETSGTAVLDHSGAGQHGVISGDYTRNIETSPVFPGGYGATEMDADVDGDRMLASAYDLSRGTNAFTMMTWVWWEDSITATQAIMYVKDAAARVLWMGLYNGWFGFYYFNGTTAVNRRATDATASGVTYAGQWVHLTYAYDVSGGPACYIDGVETTHAGTGNPAATYFPTTGFVAGEGLTSVASTVPMRLNDMMLFQGRLTANEILRCYNLQKHGMLQQGLQLTLRGVA